jgi:hypothetical protein
MVILSELRLGNKFTYNNKTHIVDDITSTSFITTKGLSIVYEDVDQLPEHGSEYSSSGINVTVLHGDAKDLQGTDYCIVRIDDDTSNILSIPTDYFIENYKLVKSAGVCSCVGLQHYSDCPLHEICY